MWEGRPIDSTNGWPIFENCSGISMSTSMVMNCGSPKSSIEETHSNSLQHRRHSEREKPFQVASDAILAMPLVAAAAATATPDIQGTAAATTATSTATDSSSSVSWQLLSVTLHRVPKVGFGIAVSSGREDPNFATGGGDPAAVSAVVVSDVIPSGPAWGLVQVNDCILSANGISLENADYADAVEIMKESQQLNMIVKRRVPVPLIEYEQRTLKFTLSKSRKKEDFGIILGCKFYIKEITNRKLAEKDPGLREGDTVLRINGQSVEGVTIEEATKWLSKSREKLSLVVQRDVRRDTSRWPSQNTVYERLGSISGTPRHSPSPMHNLHQALAQRSSLEYANTSTTSNTRWSQSEQQSIDYGDFYRRNGSIASSQGGQSEGSNVRTVRFRKIGGSLGVRVIGGNHVGIFVSAVQEDSPAALHSIRPGDRILSVNEKSMVGVTREEAVRHLLALQDDVTIKVEYASTDFERIRNGPLGDNFYIRTHFAHQKSSNQLELSFHNGDIFHITDTLFGGTVGFWQATRVYSAAENGNYAQNDSNKGVIPNAETAETLAKAARADTSTFGRSTFFRRKLKERRTKSLTKNVVDDVTFENTCDMAFPAYERVTLRHPQFQRPLVLFGPLADIARQLLLNNFAPRFASVIDESIVRLSAIDAVIAANKHCVLDVSPGSVERLLLAQYAPIVIFIDVESRSRIRELRNKAGAPAISSRKLVEQAHKIKKHYSHLLTATLDATKEDGWFDALLHLIAHLQDRRVWMPEFRPLTNLNDVILLPMHSFQNQSDSDVDSLKGDYSTSEYVTRSQLQLEKDDPNSSKPIYDSQLGSVYGAGINTQYPRPLRPVHSHPANYPPSTGMLAPRGSFYQNVHPCEPLSQYSSRLQLISNPSAVPQQQLSPIHYGNYYFESSAATMVPWATLPRRRNSHGCTDTVVLSSATVTATNSPSCLTSSVITNSPSNIINRPTNQLTKPGVPQQQSSPTFQRQQRQRNLIMQPGGGSPRLLRNPQKLPVKVSPPRSPIIFPEKSTVRDGIAVPLTSNSSTTSNSTSIITTTTNTITDATSSTSSSSGVTTRRIHPTAVSPLTTGTSNVTSGVLPTTIAQTGFYDVKQILAEHAEYYPVGGSSATSRDITTISHYENADNPLPSPYGIGGSNRIIGGSQDATNSGRTGLFYDHLTRDRWTGSQTNEKRPTATALPQIAHGNSPFLPQASGIGASALPTKAPIATSEIAYIDESLRGMHMQGATTTIANNAMTNGNDSGVLRPSHVSAANDSGGTGEQHRGIASGTAKGSVTDESVRNAADPDATVIEHASGVIDAKGGTLSCPETGVSLIIPEGAIDEGVQQEIYVKVCRASDAGSRPPLDESRGESLMSPLVMCGPQDLRFNVPVELRLPHSVSNSGENWSLALKSGTGQHWDQVALDKSASSVVTDRFVSIKISHF